MSNVGKRPRSKKKVAAKEVAETPESQESFNQEAEAENEQFAQYQSPEEFENSRNTDTDKPSNEVIDVTNQQEEVHQENNDPHQPGSEGVASDQQVGKPLRKSRVPQSYTGKYIYTSEELDELGLGLANKQMHKTELESAKKAAASSFKAQIDEVDRQIKVDSTNRQNAFVYREYSCNVFYDDDKREKIFIEKNSGIEVGRVKYSIGDDQPTIFD